MKNYLKENRDFRINLSWFNQEVADKLYLSKRTVEGHRQRMMEKIGAKNTVGLVVYAFANQIHPLSQKI